MPSPAEPIGRRLAWWAGCIVWAAAACDHGEPEPQDPEPFVIARIDGWARQEDPANDAFAAMRPVDAPACDETGYGLEQLGLSFEIKTGLCDYLTVQQPIAAPLAAGDVVEVRLWHDELQAPMPTNGYVGMAVDGEIVWELSVPIPSPYGTHTGEFTVERDVPMGTAVQYHVHNHGINAWNLLDVEATPGGTP